MDKLQALHRFWSQFNLPAYDENAVPDDAQMPYITYEAAFSSFDEGDVTLSADLWYYSTSLTEISQKAEEISQHLGFEGQVLKTDTGYIWVKRRSPFAQRLSDDSDPFIRRIYLSVSVEYIDY